MNVNFRTFSDPGHGGVDPGIQRKANASASGAGDRKFKSCRPDQYLQGATFPGSLFLFVPVLFRAEVFYTN